MRWIVLVTVFLGYSAQLKAQDTLYLSLKDALKIAATNYPQLKAARYEQEAAKTNIKIQRQSLIPQVDAAYQANIATHNNISGMVLPQYILPISGPPSTDNNYNPVTGSAASLLLQWQPGIFGDRQANINLAKAASQTLQSKNEQELFNHQAKVSSQYIDLVYVQQLLKLYEENTRLSEIQLRQVRVLAKTGLRPGVDTALVQAELSRIRIEWMKISNALNAASIALQESLAIDSVIVSKDTLFYTTIPDPFATEVTEHPFIKTARLGIEEGQVKRITIRKLTVPHLSVWGTTYARGSGVNYDGTKQTWDGFNLNRFNYGVGIQLSIPLLKHAEVKTRLQQQDWLIRSEEEQLNQVSLALKTQRKLAETTFVNALAIVQETPIQVYVAEYAFKAMQVRYTNGLVNYTELLQTQSDLLKAKIELTRSQAELWKALLYKATVYGDLNLFTNQVK